MILILPGNGWVSLPAYNLPDLTQILSASNLVDALLSSNIKDPKIVKLANLGGSTSNITLYDPYTIGLSPSSGTLLSIQVLESLQYL